MPICPACNAQVPEEANFCNNCAYTLTEFIAELVPADVLARRLRHDEMTGFLHKSLEIEEGQAALLFIGGKHDLTLRPGKHSMGSILSSRGRDTSAVLFKTSDVSMDLSVARLFTSDPLAVTLDCRLVVKIEDPALLWTNLAAGADSYDSQNLAGSLYPLVEEGCEAFFKSRSIKELDAHRSIGQELEVALASRMERPLARWGVRLVSIQGVSLRCEAWDELTQSRTEYFVAASQEQASLEGRKRLFDVFQESEIQTMAQETAEVAAVEKRVSLWERMRRAILSNAKGEIQSQAEMEGLVREADKDRLLKDDERDSLARTVTEAHEDHQMARALVLRRVEAEGEHELQKLDLWHQYGLEQERLTMETAAARQAMEERLSMDLHRAAAEIEQQRKWAEYHREQEALDQEQASAAMVGEATTRATIAGMESSQDIAEITGLVGVYDQYKRDKMARELEAQRAQLENDARKLETELAGEDRRLQMRLKESRENHGEELERIQVLSSVSIETLIAVSDQDQSQMLTQLAKTRAFAGCTPEKILAMQAAESPQVAEALKEILTATAASGQMEQYERIITELKDNAQATRGDYQRNMTMLQQMFDKALDSVKETAVAFSAVPTAVVAPQPGLSAQTAPDGTITVFFSDVEGSTAMNERLGDQRAQEVMGEHNAIVRREIKSYDGFEVKSMGDGFMLAFSSARNGVQCAIGIQRAMAAYSAEHTEEPLRVRIGLHTGEAIRESEDYFGRNVILASRISSKATGGQILVSSLLKELIESSVDIDFGEGREVELKGLSGSTRVHAVNWN